MAFPITRGTFGTRRSRHVTQLLLLVAMTGAVVLTTTRSAGFQIRQATIASFAGSALSEASPLAGLDHPSRPNLARFGMRLDHPVHV